MDLHILKSTTNTSGTVYTYAAETLSGALSAKLRARGAQLVGVHPVATDLALAEELEESDYGFSLSGIEEVPNTLAPKWPFITPAMPIPPPLRAYFTIKGNQTIGGTGLQTSGQANLSAYVGLYLRDIMYPYVARGTHFRQVFFIMKESSADIVAASGWGSIGTHALPPGRKYALIAIGGKTEDTVPIAVRAKHSDFKDMRPGAMITRGALVATDETTWHGVSMVDLGAIDCIMSFGSDEDIEFEGLTLADQIMTAWALIGEL